MVTFALDPLVLDEDGRSRIMENSTGAPSDRGQERRILSTSEKR